MPGTYEFSEIRHKYLQIPEPWKLKKIDEKRTETIMNIALQIAVSLSILSEAIPSFFSKKLKDILNVSDLTAIHATENLNAGTKINKSSLLFQN